MHASLFGQTSRPSQEKPSRLSAIVDSATHHVPYVWHELPLIDECGRLASKDDFWVVGDPETSLGSVERERLTGSLAGCGRLTDTLGTLDGDGWQLGQPAI